jgi:hypothetical protein
VGLDQEVRVDGEGFPPNDGVEVFFYDRAGEMGQREGVIMTDQRGYFSFPFRIPTFEGRAVTAAGFHTIGAHGFRCGGTCQVDVLPYDWNNAVTREVHEVCSNDFFSLSIRRVTISIGRVALDYSILNCTGREVVFPHSPTLVFRGPKNEPVGLMMGAAEPRKTQEEHDMRLVAGEQYSVRQEFAYLSEDGRNGLAPGVEAVALCLLVSGCYQPSPSR